MNRILIAESGSGYGGSAKYLTSLLPLIDRNKFEIKLVAYGKGPLIQEIGRHNWTIRQFPAWRFPHPWAELNNLPKVLHLASYALISILQLVLLTPWIALWLRRNRIQLVHLNNEILSHLPLVFAARIAGAKILCHFHGWRKLTATEKRVSSLIAGFISVTESGADFYSWQLGGREVIGIPNGLLMHERADNPNSQQVRTQTRARLGIADKDVVVTLVGRPIPLKGHAVFLRALTQARKKNPNVCALIVGEDLSEGKRFQKSLEEEVLKLGLKDRVQFLPWQDRMGPVYEASDIVVQPSVEPESFGYVALEGMAVGKPVIASRIGGLNDVVAHGETGYLVEPGNVDELSQAMIRLAGDSDLCRKLGINGRSRVQALFAMEHNAEEVQKVYEQILWTSGTKPARILIAESGSGYGGTAKYLSDLVSFVDRKEFSLEVTAYGNGPFIQKIREKDVPVTYRPSWFFPWGEDKTVRGNVHAASIANGRFGRILFSVFQLVWLIPQIAVWIRFKRVAVVHLNNDIRSHLPLMLGARIAGARVICHFHGWRPITHVEKKVARFVDEFVVLSLSGAAHLREQLEGVSIRVIPNGISTSTPEPTGENRINERLRFAVKSDETVVAILGRIVPLKGHDTYLRALAQVMAKNPKVTGLVAGYDPTPEQSYLKGLEAEASRLGIIERMRFLPWQEDVASIYDISDMIVHASREAEPFPLVIPEAMTHGKPVIASKLGGVLDLVSHNQTGILFEPESVDELAQAMSTLIEDPVLRGRIAESAQELAKKIFRPDLNAVKIEELYRSLLTRKNNASHVRARASWSVKKAIHHSGGVALLRSVLSIKTPILMYHRIFRKPDPYFPAVTSETFRKQIEYVKRHYNVISLDNLIKCWNTNRLVPERSFVITFDDTDVRTWSVIYTVLKAYKLPATIFLATGPAEEDSFIWTDRLRWWFKLTKLKSYSFQLNGTKKEWSLEGEEKRLAALREFSDELKLMENIKRKQIISQVEHEFGVQRTELPEDWTLSRAELRSADKNLITFGAHTVTHSILNRMTLDEARYEISESKKRLEEIWKERVRHFAYPNGEINDFTKEHEAMLAQSGFDSACTAILGFNDATTSHYALRRFYAREEALSHFACRLVGVGS